mmetsp:Transcript_12039/g.17940  ORF Transcript_12039/g.17940 Transcript_12039/m.17940 type:complete len:80 (-) Transcript_12039:379-618(-)
MGKHRGGGKKKGKSLIARAKQLRTNSQKKVFEKLNKIRWKTKKNYMILKYLLYCTYTGSAKCTRAKKATGQTKEKKFRE